MFDNFPGQSQIWIYGFSDTLSPDQKKIVIEKLDAFKSGWLYHGQPVKGDYTILYDRFAVLITDDSISGCSIDSSVAVFKDLKSNYNIDALNQNLIFYREHDTVKSINRPGFQKLVSEGSVRDNTIVFDLMLKSLEDLRNNKFEIEYKYSWHARAFKQPAGISA